MPRKTKETSEELNITTKPKTKATKSTVKAQTTKSASKSVAKKEAKTAATKKPKKVAIVEEKTAKADAKKTDTTKKNVAKKTTTKKTTDKKSVAKKTAKASTKATSKLTKIKKSASSTPKTKTKSLKTEAPSIVEYYDLPYKYNETVVKVLYQNPTTLFVYWEISDSDIDNYKKEFGDNFFETTKPVLVIYNDTMNYHFDIDINDFANCWYFNINDSKCDYRVELIRRPIAYNPKITTPYIYITSSNRIESPNDRILFSTNEPYTVYFRNTKNNNQRKVNLPRLLESLNLTNQNFGFPIVRNVYDLYKFIYNVDNIEAFSADLNNPSSGNPSSHTLSSRFI